MVIGLINFALSIIFPIQTLALTILIRSFITKDQKSASLLLFLPSIAIWPAAVVGALASQTTQITPDRSRPIPTQNQHAPLLLSGTFAMTEADVWVQASQ